MIDYDTLIMLLKEALREAEYRKSSHKLLNTMENLYGCLDDEIYTLKQERIEEYNKEHGTNVVWMS